MDIDLEFSWGLFLLIFAALLVSLGWYAVTRDRPVRGYYLNHGVSGLICVKADIDWYVDPDSFCTDEIGKATATLKTLTEALPGK